MQGLVWNESGNKESVFDTIMKINFILNIVFTLELYLLMSFFHISLELLLDKLKIMNIFSPAIPIDPYPV